MLELGNGRLRFQSHNRGQRKFLARNVGTAYKAVDRIPGDGGWLL